MFVGWLASLGKQIPTNKSPQLPRNVAYNKESSGCPPTRVEKALGSMISRKIRVCVCCFVLLNQYWGIVTVQGFPQRWAKEHVPTKRIATVPHQNVPPYRTWGSWILTLYLNYVAGYTDPLIFLSEQTHT